VSVAAGEKPEDIKVAGATKGSIILGLLATYALVRLLAMISKEIASVTRNLYAISNIREQAKQEKIKSKILEQEYLRLEKEAKSNGVDKIMAAIKKELPKGTQNDAIAGLKKSIEKLIKFNENGGTLDFVSPANEDDEDPDTPLAEIRQLIHDAQNEREAVKLLTDESANDND